MGHVAGLFELVEGAVVYSAIDITLSDPADGRAIKIRIRQMSLELLWPADLEREVAAY